MRSLFISTLWVMFFCSIIFFGVKCQKDQDFKLSVGNPIEKIPSSHKGQTELSTRAQGDTLYRVLEYGATLKVYPNTITRCWNKKKARFEYQATLYGDTLLHACKYQQISYYDKITISDTALITPNSKYYITEIKIK